MKKLKQQKGITLVALIVTIIILLILAGISIAGLTQTGLFTKAKEAKQNTLDAQLKENTILNEYDELIAKYGSSEGQPITNVDTSKTNPEGAKPKGVTVIDGDATKGIVIKDSNDNEWVWVEVPKNIFTTAKSSSEYDNIKVDLIEYAKDYRSSGYTDEWYAMDGSTLVTASTSGLTETQKALKNGCGLTYNEYQMAYQKMLSSVYTNGGFWISRYEAGIEGTNTDETINEIPNVRYEYEHSGITNSSQKAVSQADRIPYNYVTCSEAQTLASAMSTDSSKTSSLLFGIQWDLTCKFLQEKGGLKITEIKGGDGVGSTNWGNYANSSISLTRGKYNTNPNSSNSKWINVTKGAKNEKMILTTGASEDTKKMNIYDLAGNEWEWTLEKSSITVVPIPCVYGGGGYDATNGSDSATYYRAPMAKDSVSDGISFRSTLY